MSSYGRSLVPGEKAGVSAVLRQEAVFNRTIRAQVAHVYNENGLISCVYEALPGGRQVTVPPLWMSFPSATQGKGPAWGRYMPQESDIIKLSFDHNGRAHAMGYDVIANDYSTGVADGSAGWPILNDIYNNRATASTSTFAKISNFKPLNPGEYDFMSSGGAYIYGNDMGCLYLAGGTVSVSLVKNDLRLSSRAQLWSHSADDCEFRFGQVRRAKTNGTEGTVPADATRVFKEFTARVKSSSRVNVASLSIGNVVDENGGVQTTPTAGNDERFSYKAYNDAGTEVLHMAIDKLGNWDMIAPTATTGVNFDFSAGDWLASCKEMNFTATTSYTLNSPKIYLGGPEAVINPLILSTPYQAAESTVLGALSTNIGLLGAANVTINAAVLAAVIAGNTAIGAAVASNPSLAGLATAVTGTFTGIATALTNPAASATLAAPGVAAATAVSTFVSAYPTYLSDNTYTK